MISLGLIGRNIDYSYSPVLFNEFFENEGVESRYVYQLFDLASRDEVEKFIHQKAFHGANVTIPYKEVVAEICDHLVGHAKVIRAVNTIVWSQGQLIGFNTDVYGIIQAWKAQVDHDNEKHVLILGSGGAARAVTLACNVLGYTHQIISRQGGDEALTYDELATSHVLSEFDIIVNCTPLGSRAHIDACPQIQYGQITEHHFVHDLIYNPDKTLLLKRSQAAGASIQNGMPMLRAQAQLSWGIWKKMTSSI